MVKKMMAMVVILILMALAFTACVSAEEREMEKILKQFDLSDPKEIWTGTVDDDFNDDSVCLVMRKTSIYPKLELRHFKLENAESLEYLGGERPPDYFFTPGYEDALEHYRQLVVIRLKPLGKEKILETIRQLEQLSFIKSAEPNGIGELNTAL